MNEQKLFRKYKLFTALSVGLQSALAFSVCLLAMPTIMLSITAISTRDAMHESVASLHTLKTISPAQLAGIINGFTLFFTITVTIIALVIALSFFTIYTTIRSDQLKKKIIKSMSKQVIAVNYTSDFGSNSAIYLKKDSPWRALITNPNAPSPFCLKNHHGQPSNLPAIVIKNTLAEK